MARRAKPALRKSIGVLRVWRGRAAGSNSNGYPAYFRRHVLPRLKRIGGFQAVLLVKRKNRRQIEFVVLTKWSSMKAIRRFAGATPGKAVIEPGAVAELIGFDRKARHYDIVAEA